MWRFGSLAALVAALVMGASGAVAQAVGVDMVRHMAAAVELSGHDCEGMAGMFLGEVDGKKIYIVECRGGDRFVYMDLPGDQVSVTSCAAMRMQGYDC